MEIWWDGTGLLVFEGDEIEILRGIVENHSVRASVIRNITKGREFRSYIEHGIMTKMPQDITPPLRGYVSNVRSDVNILFDLEEKAPPIIAGILRQCNFLDRSLYERCKDKDYHDVITNAFPILEDRIRSKVGIDRSYSGKKLIDYAFNTNTGKLILGETSDERQSFYFMFIGANGFLRNPPSHHIDEETSESHNEAFNVICMVDLLLRLVDRAELRE